MPDDKGVTPKEHMEALLAEHGGQEPLKIMGVMATDDFGNPDVLQVEEPNGQQRMVFLTTDGS